MRCASNEILLETFIDVVSYVSHHHQLFPSFHALKRCRYVVWIDRTIEGKRDGTAAGLLEECVLDDDEGKCERFTNALTKLDHLLGVGAAEQY